LPAIPLFAMDMYSYEATGTTVSSNKVFLRDVTVIFTDWALKRIRCHPAKWCSKRKRVTVAATERVLKNQNSRAD
jgi:hypothetical protein